MLSKQSTAQGLFLLLMVISFPAHSSDSDDDGIDDSQDNCPSTSNADQIDADRDGLGNACDADDDGDGVVDTIDLYPLDGRYSADANNNGFPDKWESLYEYTGNPEGDVDADGFDWREEYEYQTSPVIADTDLDTIPDGLEIGLGDSPTSPKYSVEVGDSHACAIDDDGVKCWGGNNFGQLNVPFLNDPRQVGAGIYHSCALDSNGVTCWGANYSGQLNVPPLTNPTELAVGADANCAIDDTGIVCWGSNGDNKTEAPTLSNPRDLKAGRWQFCAIDDSGLNCWGFNGNNESDIPKGIFPESYDTGRYSTCAVVDRSLQCWGLLSYFDRARNFPNIEIKDIAVTSLQEEGLCVLSEDGVTHCKDIEGRYNRYLGDGIAAIDSYEDHFCHLDQERVTCWFPNDLSNRSLSANFLFAFDPDGDGVSRLYGDEMPFDPNELNDSDGDGIGDNSDSDRDGDGVDNDDDLYPDDPNEAFDTDGDGVGDNADAFPEDPNETEDTDHDGIGDNSDNCVDLSNPDQTDTDNDSFGNACDSDDDNDGLEDVYDAFPLDPSEQIDQDNDGTGDNADAFPLDPSEQTDTDGDGVGNNSDEDDDNDGYTDEEETEFGTDPLNPRSSPTSSEEEYVSGMPVWLRYIAIDWIPQT